MHTLTAILVDDEINSLENLQQKITAFCPHVKIAAMSQIPEQAIVLIHQLKPNVLFLDIEMPQMNGFKMLEELNDMDFDIVFTTAYSHYTIDAIRLSAFDYLVKPIVVSELQNCIGRLLQKHSIKTKEKLHVLLQSLQQSKTQENKIAIHTFDGIVFLQIKSIIHIEASANYCKIILDKESPLLVTGLLKDFEEMLLQYNFYRIHNSHLINMVYIKKYLRGEGGQLVMQNGDVIEVSRRKKEEFVKLISK